MQADLAQSEDYFEWLLTTSLDDLFDEEEHDDGNGDNSNQVCADSTRFLGDTMIYYLCRDYDATPYHNSSCPTDCSEYEDMEAPEGAEYRYGCTCHGSVTSEQECKIRWQCTETDGQWSCATKSGGLPKHNFAMHCNDLVLDVSGMCTSNPAEVQGYANVCCQDMQSICDREDHDHDQDHDDDHDNDQSAHNVHRFPCTGLYVCMYVVMYVCMYVCTYVCMHACMCVCVYVSMRARAHTHTHTHVTNTPLN